MLFYDVITTYLGKQALSHDALHWSLMYYTLCAKALSYSITSSSEVHAGQPLQGDAPNLDKLPQFATDLSKHNRWIADKWHDVLKYKQHGREILPAHILYEYNITYHQMHVDWVMSFFLWCMTDFFRSKTHQPLLFSCTPLSQDRRPSNQKSPFLHAFCNTFLCWGQSAAWKVCWSPDACHVTGPSQGETSVTLDGLWGAEQEAALEYELLICNAATIFSSPREYEPF